MNIHVHSKLCKKSKNISPLYCICFNNVFGKIESKKRILIHVVIYAFKIYKFEGTFCGLIFSWYSGTIVWIFVECKFIGKCYLGNPRQSV